MKRVDAFPITTGGAYAHSWRNGFSKELCEDEVTCANDSSLVAFCAVLAIEAATVLRKL